MMKQIKYELIGLIYFCIISIGLTLYRYLPEYWNILGIIPITAGYNLWHDFRNNFSIKK